MAVDAIAHGRETTRRGRTRERLMDAAYRMFAQHGVHGTSIEAIADDAGFTRGAFYSNFDSKTELFFALIERENELLLGGLRERMPELLAPLREHAGRPDRTLIERVCADIMPAQIYRSQWWLMYGEFRLLAMRDAEVAARFLAIDRGFREQMAEFIDAVAEPAGVRLAIETTELAGLLVNQQEAAMREAILSNVDDPGAMARELVLRSLPTLIDRLIDPA